MNGRKALADVTRRYTTAAYPVKAVHGKYLGASKYKRLAKYLSPFADAQLDPRLFGESGVSVSRATPSRQRLGVRFFIVHGPPDKPSPITLSPGVLASIRMLNWVQIVATPTADTSGTSIVLHFDNQRYVFGSIGEGSQRAMVQRKVSLNKTENLFMTGVVNWENAGGLMGTVLTIADILASAKEQHELNNVDRKKRGLSILGGGFMTRLNVHGGKNLSHLLATSRRFIFRKGFPLRPYEVRSDPRLAPGASGEPDFKDANINVWYMPVESSNSSSPPSRKRSHDEFSETSENDDNQHGNTEEDRKVVETVVKQMFESDWKMDALVETNLHEAKLPAKLFVRNQKGHIEPYTGPMPGDGENVPSIPVLVRQPWPGAMVGSLPRTTPSSQSMCYIVKGHDRRGRFNPQEAIKHGVPKNDFKLLTRGESVTGTDGVVVTPQMVLGETVPGKGFAVVDLPDTSYVETLTNRAEWANEHIMKGIHVIYWLLGPGVVDDARIQEFMAKRSSIRHIVTSPDRCPNMLALESVATQAYKLHSIDPERFPLPIFSNKRSLLNTPVTPSTDAYEVGRTGKTIQFAPDFLHQDDKIISFPDIPKLAAADVSQEARKEVEELTKQGRARLSDPAFLEKIEKVESDIPNRDAEVITLGTGSALPSKYRNVSATLLRVPGYGNYLFDCGENTLGQLRRVFGDELPEVLRDLKAIWISHLHADHHLGTVGVIRAWHEETSKTEATAQNKLMVASHLHMIDWLREYADVEDYGYHRLSKVPFRNGDNGKRATPQPPRIFSAEETAAVGLSRIDACYVSHCYGALATVFTWPSGLRVAYSGDCRPSNTFAAIGRGATLLIHESTFDDELRGDALAKKHSTTSEAIDIGRRMGARRILLTHFSQRYQKVPIFEDENFGEEREVEETVLVPEGEVEGQGKVEDSEESSEGGEAEAAVVEEEGVQGAVSVPPEPKVKKVKRKAKNDEVILLAFDYMRVKLGDFRKAQMFLPAVQRLFDDVQSQ